MRRMVGTNSTMYYGGNQMGLESLMSCVAYGLRLEMEAIRRKRNMRNNKQLCMLCS